jgi:cytoskeletal protein CcmA (bactofilin family)
VVPPGTRVEGLIDCPGDLVIEGECVGQLEVRGTLTVAAGAVCRAGVRARSAQIYGDVIGNILATDWVTVAAAARVVGDIRASDVSVDPAAEIDGTIDLLPPDPDSVELVRATVQERGPALRRPVPPPRRPESRR